MSFSETIKPMTKLCQLLGLAPYSHKANSSKWISNCSYEIVTISFLILIALIFVTCLIFNGAIVDHTDSGLIVAIVIYSLIIVCDHSFVILYETFKKRNDHIKLLNLLGKLESSLKHQQNIQLNHFDIKQTMRRGILFWILETFGLLSLSILTWLKTQDMNDLFFFLTYTTPHLISKLSFIYWIVLNTVFYEIVNGMTKYTNTLSAETQEVNYDLVPFKLINWKYKRARCGRIDANTIEYLKQCYNSIWEASRLLNDIVLWSFPIGFVNEFSVLVLYAIRNFAISFLY